jgi:serine/threonine protein kinase
MMQRMDSRISEVAVQSSAAPVKTFLVGAKRPLKPRSAVITDFEIEEEIGAGRHSTIFRALNKAKKRLVALKIIPKESFTTQQ